MSAASEQSSYLVLENFIGGKFVPCRSHIDSFDPSTGEVYCKVPDSGKEEVEAAVAAAKEAFPGWAARSPEQRAQILNKLADLIDANLDELAHAESRDQGKTVTFARTVDIPRAAHNFRFFASSVLHHTNDCSQMDHMGCLNYTIRCPVGVAGLISPWNLPLYLLTWKVAPAIAAGNTVVAKPSEMTSVTAWMMCKLLQQAGVPPGVVNIVFGTGLKAGDALVGHPEVPLVSFTGSTATAQHITTRSAPYCKKLSLELGGKNPAIIFADANLDQCIETTVRSSFSNQGEICLCTSRIYVERSIYSEFLEKFVAASKKWKTGLPSDPNNNNGALISKEHLEKVRSFVALAKSEGGVIHCGEGIDQMELPKKNANGYFMPATVISGVSDSSRVMQEEIFGPVTCVSPFDTEDEAVSKGNGVRYGLAATVWSQDVGKVHRVAKRLQAGLVWTNCWLVRDLNLPFGGMKLNYHSQIHTGEKTFSCSVCGKSFFRLVQLRLHSLDHTGKIPFTCSVCGKQFAQRGTLKKHSAMHAEVKPFSCSVCGKRFAQHGNLKRHSVVHTGEKPFSCCVCERKFTQHDYLKRHKCVRAAEIQENVRS